MHRRPAWAWRACPAAAPPWPEPTESPCRPPVRVASGRSAASPLPTRGWERDVRTLCHACTRRRRGEFEHHGKAASKHRPCVCHPPPREHAWEAAHLPQHKIRLHPLGRSSDGAITSAHLQDSTCTQQLSQGTYPLVQQAARMRCSRERRRAVQ